MFGVEGPGELPALENVAMKSSNARRNIDSLENNVSVSLTIGVLKKQSKRFAAAYKFIKQSYYVHVNSSW